MRMRTCWPVLDAHGDGAAHGPLHGQADGAADCTKLVFEQMGAAMVTKLVAGQQPSPALPNTGRRIVTYTVPPTVRLSVRPAVGESIAARSASPWGDAG